MLSTGAGPRVPTETALISRTSPSMPNPAVWGFDVSLYAKVLDWQRLRSVDDLRGEYSFAIIEVARGKTLSTNFGRQWREASDVGLLRGPYQRFFSTFSAASHVAAFTEAFPRASLVESDLPPALDIERDPNNLADTAFGPALSPQRYLEEIQTWVSSIRLFYQREPMIYTSVESWSSLLNNSAAFETLPLWLADYHSINQPPKTPPPWSRYRIWQYAANQSVYDGGPIVDMDVFDGTLDDLRRLVASSCL